MRTSTIQEAEGFNKAIEDVVNKYLGPETQWYIVSVFPTPGGGMSASFTESGKSSPGMNGLRAAAIMSLRSFKRDGGHEQSFLFKNSQKK